ncbi:LysR family transcriptional regulator [Eikenella sp. S3360]|uniref:LysR family transcriptional regulator n=1 Tax=Eikenella glucosivorans TaxID=2766967 RepID=A0ABS0N9T8_9NEIS|nr:LysR family transcriptional regulator [Eikenella glucosivorans]MBH5329051.1 LysR family transcriptional regulator [Eikenella glucosivorans]
MSHLNNLDLNLLKALHALLEERNVTRAAARLSLSQPAVSGMLARLRQYFDDPILVRTAQGMMPTNRAAALAEPLARIIGEIETLVQPAEFVPAELEAVFKIGTIDNSFHSVGIPFAAKLQTLAPNARVAFFNLRREEMEDKLAKGELDAAIAAHVAAPDRLRYKKLYHENFICALREGHPVLQQEWTLDTFCRQTFVLGSFYGGSFTGATDRELAKLGKSRRVALSVQNFALIPDLLRQSDLLAVVPSRLVQHGDRLATLPLPFASPGYDKLLLWHERSHFDVVQQWMRGVLEGAVQRGAT